MRKLVEQITSNIDLVDSHGLQDDIQVLGERLQDVRNTILLLADAAEGQHKCETEYNTNIMQAKDEFSNVQEVRKIFVEYIHKLE